MTISCTTYCLPLCSQPENPSKNLLLGAIDRFFNSKKPPRRDIAPLQNFRVTDNDDDFDDEANRDEDSPDDESASDDELIPVHPTDDED